MCNLRVSFYIACFLLIISGCKKDLKEPATVKSVDTLTSKIPPLFTLIQPASSGVNFINTLDEGPNTYILVYEYFYNGGGVATGDLNGDGLEDIYFSSNMGNNTLY